MLFTLERFDLCKAPQHPVDQFNLYHIFILFDVFYFHLSFILFQLATNCRWLDNNFKFFVLDARLQLAKKELKKTFKQSIQCTLKSQTHIIVFYIEIADTNIPIALSNNVIPLLLVLRTHGAKICALISIGVPSWPSASVMIVPSKQCWQRIHSKFTISTNREWIKPNLRAFTVWSQFSVRCFHTL